MSNRTVAKPQQEQAWAGPASQGPVDAARAAFSEYAKNRDMDQAELSIHIQHAMESEDPEFLVELGEQLAMGIVISRDFQSAEMCFRRAQSFSDVMGSYALGRLYFESNPSLAKEFFRRASKQGHISSRVLLNTLMIPSNPTLKKLAYFIRTFSFSPFLFRGYKALLFKEHRARVLFWRYQDDMRPIPSIDGRLGRDRNIYFPWTRPIHVKLFSAACQSPSPSLD